MTSGDVLRLDDKGGSLRCSLPGFLERAFEGVFFGPKVEFEWSEVQLVERVQTTMFVSRVRFKIMQQGEPEMLVLDASDETVEERLVYAQPRGASVGFSRGGQLCDSSNGSIFAWVVHDGMAW